MTAFDPTLDLSIQRIIRAPRAAVWAAWADPAQFEQWFLPAPHGCKVEKMELRNGGALVTLMNERPGEPFGPHVNGCFLNVIDGEQIVYTTLMTGGWRPADKPFLSMTALITFKDHPEGTDYSAVVKHQNPAAKDQHVEWGFYDGWGTVNGQLAALVERA